MERVHLANALVFRKDQRGLYFRDKDGWMPVQVPARVHHHFNTDRFDKLNLDLIWESGTLEQCFKQQSLEATGSTCPAVLVPFLLLTFSANEISFVSINFFLPSPSSHSSPQRKSRTELVHVGMERCSPSTERSAMTETRSSQTPVSVRELSQQRSQIP